MHIKLNPNHRNEMKCKTKTRKKLCAVVFSCCNKYTKTDDECRERERKKCLVFIICEISMARKNTMKNIIYSYNIKWSFFHFFHFFFIYKFETIVQYTGRVLYKKKKQRLDTKSDSHSCTHTNTQMFVRKNDGGLNTFWWLCVIIYSTQHGKRW